MNSTNNTDSQNVRDVITNQEKETTVHAISDKFLDMYVFPDVAKEMSDLIIKNLKKGNYASFDNPHVFASQLTEDLLSISHDKHINVRYNPQEIATQKQASATEDSLDNQNQYFNNLKRENFGFKTLKILEGNIGYLDLRSFCHVKYAGEIAVATMNFLSNSDAIIIDLRMNGGGSPTMIQLITSYLFSGDPIHLNNFYWRPTDSHTQTWTLPHVQGKKSPETAVYVLTSKRTASAAEEFSYNLKNLKRATLIGETTAGAAHPVDTVHIADKFTVMLPVGRAINPITNTNWEGTGVIPHIEVPFNQALEVAHIKALETLLEKGEDARQSKFYEWHLRVLNALREPLIIEPAILRSYTGVYGRRKVSIDADKLYYQRGEADKSELIPLTKNEFFIKNNHSFKIKFIVENGQTVGLEGFYDNGHSDYNLKTENT